MVQLAESSRARQKPHKPERKAKDETSGLLSDVSLDRSRKTKRMECPTTSQNAECFSPRILAWRSSLELADDGQLGQLLRQRGSPGCRGLIQVDTLAYIYRYVHT